MLLDLLIGKLEHLEAIGVGGLGGFSLGKVVHDLLVRISLLYVIVVEVHYRVPVWEGLSPHAIAEDDFFLAVRVCSLDLTVVALDVILELGVFRVLVMVVLWELHLIVFVIIFRVSHVVLDHLLPHFLFFVDVLVVHFGNVL